MAPGSSAERGRARTIAAAIVAGLVIAAGSFLLGRLGTLTETTPTTTSVEAGFARDMQEHHAQAVEMSLLVRDRTSDTDVRLLAYDIATSQSQQAGQMYGWLTVWGLPQAPAEPSMTWMSRPPINATAHPHAAGHTPGAAMPGMATREQLVALAAASGVEAERLYLELMLDHHLGGVEMASAVLERSTQRVVVDLARSIVTAQQAEIGLIEDMLALRR
jgi:uncharacterized protein (DUF305 family)